MKWIDYRQELGIGFYDDDKARLFVNKISVMIDVMENSLDHDEEEGLCQAYFIEVCETPDNHYALYEVKKSIKQDTSNLGVPLSKTLAMVNVARRSHSVKSGELIKKCVLKSLDDLGILYDEKTDEDGIFLFPRGAKELDEANVAVPYEWLREYPKAHVSMKKALESYNNKNDYSTTADLFRKSLEAFGQEFFESRKSLEHLKVEFGQYLKGKGVPKELRENFETTLQMYTNYMNNYAKHQDRTAEKYLEFIMYQTGNIIRFVISLKNEN